MRSIQRLLSEYLQCELYHSMGAYGVAENRLGSIAAELREAPSAPGAAPLLRLVELAEGYNKLLASYRHASLPELRSHPDHEHRGWPARDPLPTNLPFSEVERFAIGPADDETLRLRREPWKNPHDWVQVPKFYSEAIEALERYGPHPTGHDEREMRFRQKLAESLITPRDGGAWWESGGLERRDLRLDRYRHRRRAAHLALSPDTGRQGVTRLRELAERARATLGAEGTGQRLSEDLGERYLPDPAFLQQIATDHLSRSDDSLGLFVVRAQAEAHLSMHGVEAWKGMCLGEQAESLGRSERRWLHEELDRSIALSTFAYCVSRTAPWLFAENDAERETVFEKIAGAWENVVPPRCLWIANQIGLLALHRRAYAWSLRGDSEQSYNDYHKLQQLTRDAERRIRTAPIHVKGALEFLAGLNAEAHHHIGELYRAEHAHKPALKHFEAATHRLNQLRDEEQVTDILVDSRWNVELQISRGKACYEMGRHKEALYWHLHAWQAFLELFAAGNQTETNTEAIKEAIAWLDSVRFEPELRKSEISERLRPVVDQLDRITTVGSLGALAAEILLRLGHLLFVLNVGFEGVGDIVPEGEVARERDARERIRGTLAFGCLLKAAECDPHSTLVGADLLKARFRLAQKIAPEYSGHLGLPEIKPIGQHWPRGGDDYELLTRAAEYMLLEAHAERMGDHEPEEEPDSQPSDALVARDLLLNLFMSTDSINVRKAQIHRFLMKPPIERSIPGNPSPSIEFICMRRYSSPFPLLPRPSAFRALGGGYFLRLHGTQGDAEDSEQAFGVVIDPGVDFVENLYRSGYSLSDIDMILITHDHVDHLGALDPLLSLLHVRSEILSQQARRVEAGQAPEGEPTAAKKVKVLMSRSVDSRYSDVTRLRQSDEFAFACFEQIKGEDGVLDPADPILQGFPEPFEIIAMSSASGHGQNGGHRDLSRRPSHGVCFRVAGGAGPSVAITSDTPAPPAPEEQRGEWRRTWRPALEADVLVAHLGSVPLTELRRMDQADVDEGERDRTADEGSLAEFRDSLQESNRHLQGQIEYAQWLRSHVPKGADPITAPLVGHVQPEWLPPTDHNYLTGLLSWARSYIDAGPDGLFVIGELSEELASMRGKIASRLKDRLFNVPNQESAIEERKGDKNGGVGTPADQPPSVLTADIGLHVCITPDPDGQGRRGCRVKVLCTTCNLDTDRAPGDRYHLAHGIYEVCVKGENEGIFYNCLEHDPTSQEDPTFLEQLERFDIFGR